VAVGAIVGAKTPAGRRDGDQMISARADTFAKLEFV
jgi:hypothetical protein